jgi:hypothetical protein
MMCEKCGEAVAVYLLDGLYVCENCNEPRATMQEHMGER